MNIAAIDIGSNSVHMIIARVDDHGAYQIVDREKDMIKLGAAAFRAGRLPQESFDAGVRSLTRFRRLIEHHQVEHVLAVATSAVREAENGEDFLRAVREKTGFEPRIVSGQEEARLIHLAVRDVLDLSDRKALIVDVGGGSVETILGNERSIVIGESLALGVLRLRNLVGDADPLPREARRRLESLVRERAGPVLARSREAGFDLLVGTSGTILDLGETVVRRRETPVPTSADGRIVERDELRELAEHLSEMDARERGRVPGVDANRADTIHLGALLVVGIMDLAKVDVMAVCDVSIREGMILDHLEGLNGRLTNGGPRSDVRMRSVEALLRRCGQDEAHARHVADLSLSIFDQTQSVHQLGSGDRRVLECAGLLHDAGRCISFHRHELHSYYLIAQGGLRGLAEKEVELIALTARYHRKGGPKPRHPEYAALSPRLRRTVRILAGILRIAEGLDRGHAQAVSCVRCDVSPTRLRVLIRSAGDAELEAWAAGRKGAMLSTALDRAVVVELDACSLQTP